MSGGVVGRLHMVEGQFEASHRFPYRLVLGVVVRVGPTCGLPPSGSRR
jgi:hypothetical protein